MEQLMKELLERIEALDSVLEVEEYGQTRIVHTEAGIASSLAAREATSRGTRLPKAG